MNKLSSRRLSSSPPGSQTVRSSSVLKILLPVAVYQKTHTLPTQSILIKPILLGVICISDPNCLPQEIFLKHLHRTAGLFLAMNSMKNPSDSRQDPTTINRIQSRN